MFITTNSDNIIYQPAFYHLTWHV